MAIALWQTYSTFTEDTFTEDSRLHRQAVFLEVVVINRVWA